MATQRIVKGSSEQKTNGTSLTDEKTYESAVKTSRQSKKAQILKEQQRNARLRWALVAILLAVAAVGFCYWLWYYQSIDLPRHRKTPPRSSQQQQQKEKEKAKSKNQKQTEKSAGEKQKQKTAGEKQKSAGKKQKSAGGKAATKAKNKDKAKSDGAKKEDKMKKGGKTKSREEKETEIERMERLKRRVLRQPLGGGDPDRPHVLDIITADNLLIEGQLQEALDRFNAILSQFPQSPRAQLGKGLTLVRMAKEKRSNKLMDTAIEFFRKAGLESLLSTDAIKQSALLAMVDHARERGNMKLAVEGTEKLVELFDDNMVYANQLGMLHLSQGDVKKAKTQFERAVEKFDDNHFGQAQVGQILFVEKNYEQALPLLLEGIRKDEDIKTNGNFYNSAGSALTKLNRSEEAFALYGEAVGLGVFPSVWQRSLMNEPGLTASPWWSPEDTGYMTDFTRIEKNTQTIANEALALFDVDKMAFVDGSERESPHYVLFSKGKKNLKNCQRARKTCSLLETFPEATGCKQGTIKFSSLPPNTHVSPHVGKTNAKLQVLVGLDMDPEDGIQIRMAEQMKTLKDGQIGVIDESFETEVWYTGNSPALYLTIDVWHPDLSSSKRVGLL